MSLYYTIYTFEDVKRLFDEYNIKADGNGGFQAVKRGSAITYDNKDFVDKIKFAHTWVAATRYGSPRPTPAECITPEEYSNAFNEEAKAIYDFIMDASSQTLIEDGKLIEREQLRALVQKAILRAHSEEVVDGLYSNHRFLESFYKWVRACNNLPTNPEALKEEVRAGVRLI